MVGSFYILISSLFFGSYGMWAKLIGGSLDNFYQVFARSIVVLAVLIPIGLLTKQFKKIHREDFKWYAIYSGAGMFTYAPYFYAFNVIGIGPATLLYYACLTIAAYIAGAISFQEKMTPVKIVALILALIGLSLVFNLSLSGHTVVAALAAIIAGTAGGIEATYTKKLSGKYSPLQIIIFTWTMVLIAHGILSKLLHESWTSISFSLPWLAVLGYSVASFSGYFFMVLGYKHSEPSVAAIVGLMEIIFGITFGLIFFHEILTINIMMGGALIILAAALPNLFSLQLPRHAVSSAITPGAFKKILEN